MTASCCAAAAASAATKKFIIGLVQLPDREAVGQRFSGNDEARLRKEEAEWKWNKGLGNHTFGQTKANYYRGSSAPFLLVVSADTEEMRDVESDAEY